MTSPSPLSSRNIRRQIHRKTAPQKILFLETATLNLYNNEPLAKLHFASGLETKDNLSATSVKRGLGAPTER